MEGENVAVQITSDSFMLLAFDGSDRAVGTTAKIASIYSQSGHERDGYDGGSMQGFLSVFMRGMDEE
jgi:hypothetical protein